MDTTPAVARRPSAQVWPVIAGAALVAAGIWLAVAERQAIPAAIAGAGGLALLRWALAERPYSQALVASTPRPSRCSRSLRNDGLGFWQLPGPWLDVLRFNLPSAAIALILYAAASAMALIAGSRGLRVVEALSLIAVPFLFNLLIVVGADWHMAELGAVVDPARGPAVPGPGRDRAGAHAVVARRGDADPDRRGQPQPAAALAAGAWRCSRSAAPTPPSRR